MGCQTSEVPVGSEAGAGLNDGLFQKRWTFSDNRDFTVCIIRCVYRGELILGRLFTYRIRIPVLQQYQFIKREIKVPYNVTDIQYTYRAQNWGKKLGANWLLDIFF